MNPYSDEKIVDSWVKNASQWSSAVQGGHIESRNLITNKAIVEAVLSHSPKSVLDIGCGEGWLVRELSSQVPHLLGVDVVPDLIEQAKSAGGGHFLVVSYEDVAGGAVEGLFDVVVCNFSLLGKESVEALFVAIPAILNPGGALIVQTPHPMMAGDLPYIDGWRGGSWTGFGSGFIDPAPWYFRTLENWVALFSGNGFRLLDVREPIHPKTHKPASIIFTGERSLNGSVGSKVPDPSTRTMD
jgi:2-polyprenyl-3-methyl-5-hydroxy-6-metoxy-1,4-benzoquinol methylase|tara:strand:- start:45 stop:770 length:726 start_codon:yes stop_codon:yes gene_type:complete